MSWIFPAEFRTENSLQALHIEALEHNLGGVFPVLGRVEWGFGLNYQLGTFIDKKKGSPTATHKQDIVIFWLGTEILEYTLFPESLHVIPVLDLAVLNGIVQVVCPGGISYSSCHYPLIHPLLMSTLAAYILRSRYSLGIRNRLISDIKVQILNPAFTRQMARLARYWRRRPPAR
jgi:hypothetical protein